MPYPYADPALFTGLFAHMERHLGPVQYATSPTGAGHNRGFAVGIHRHPTSGTVSAATSGVRFQRTDAPLPQEFVCAALPGQEVEVEYLVHLVAEHAVRTGREYGYGTAYGNGEPFIPETHIDCLLGVPYPWAPAEFHDYLNGEGEPVLRIVGLLPITFAEANAVEPGGNPLQRLVDLVSSKGLDPRDLLRASAV